jgi:hypothetical protein
VSAVGVIAEDHPVEQSEQQEARIASYAVAVLAAS